MDSPPPTNVKALKEVFAQDTKDREQSLITKLHTCKRGNFSISYYLKRIKGIYDIYDDLATRETFLK